MKSQAVTDNAEKSGIDLKGTYDVYRDGKLKGNVDTILIKHVALLNKHMNKDFVVLDIGCGLGQLSAELSKRSGTVYAVDPSDYNIRKAAELNAGKNIEYIVADGTGLEFGDGKFDIIVSSEVIEHVKDAARFISEMRRVGKDGAVYSISSPNLLIFLLYPFYWIYALCHPVKYFKIITMNDNIREYKELYDRWFYPGSLKRMFRRHGFEVMESSALVSFSSRIYYEKRFGKGAIARVLAGLDDIVAKLYSKIPYLKDICGTRFFLLLKKGPDSK